MVRSLGPMHSTQHLPRRNELLNCGGEWEPLSVIVAVRIRRLVNFLHAIHAEHLQTASELRELFPVQKWLQDSGRPDFWQIRILFAADVTEPKNGARS